MRRLRCLLALSGTFLLSIILPATVFAGSGAKFGLRPVTYDPSVLASQSYFVFDARPGTTVTSKVRVTNSGDAAGTARLYPVDATTGQTSGTVYRMRQEPRRDTGAWITLATDKLTLQPGESADVAFSVAIPADARPGQHVGGIVAEDTALKTSTATQPGANQAGLRVNIQSLTILAVQVNLPGTPVERLDVTGITSGGEQGHQTLVLGLRNSGTVMLKPSGTLQVATVDGQELQTLPIRMDTFLPDTTIDYPVFVTQALGAGEYRATLTLTYGAGRETRYTTTFAITNAQVGQVFQGRPKLTPPPVTNQLSPVNQLLTWPLAGIVAGALVLLAGSLLGFVTWRRRRLSGARW